MTGLVELAAQRILLADKVAAAKFGTSLPIDDPVREQQLLDSVATMSRTTGVDPDAIVQFFRDQIEANKVVQRGLHSRWDTDPETRPMNRPDLSSEVRPQLDEITHQILLQFRSTQQYGRHAKPDRPTTFGSGLPTELRQHLDDLDELHRDALITVALRSMVRQPAA